MLITYLEHHANIVPWQILCEQTGAKLMVAPMDERGEVHVEAVEALMSPRTRLFAFAHVSNALGTVLPVRRLIAAAKARGITTLIDGAQAVPHMAVDVQELGCDFYAFSGHKLFGPTGIGVLYGREALLERDAALAGRRGHDPRGQLREDDLQQSAVQIRSGYAQYLGRHRSRCRRGLLADARIWKQRAHTSMRCSTMRPAP